MAVRKRRLGLKAVYALLCLWLLTGCQKRAAVVTEARTEEGYGLPEIMVIAMSQKQEYEEICTDQIWSVSVPGGEGETFESYTKEMLKDFMDEMKIMNLLAEEKGVELTKEEQTAMEEAAEEYYSGLTDQDRSYMGISGETVYTVFHDYCLANKLAGELTGDVNMEVSDSEAKVIAVTQIRTDSREEAEGIQAAVQAGETFEQAAADAGFQAEDRRLGRAEESQDFDTAAFALETGEVSGIIEDNGSFYLLRCDDDYDEEATAERKEQIFEARRQRAFQDLYGSFKNGITLTDPEQAWESLSLQDSSWEGEADFFEIYHTYTETAGRTGGR